ncbi:MAG: hypothetical protein B6I20_02805 [Bacteroidetes bacterium 4572_117]|nr:MAG: hypothetical protein B6I20_02805 [Bacteroidetes bacterium 4572_117]
MQNLEIILTYKRQERSKDSNGSKKIYIIKDNKMSYEDEYWGFRSANIPMKKISQNLTKEDIAEIYAYLHENSLLKNINKKIKQPHVPYVIYDYELKIVTEKDSFLITVQGNNKKKSFSISIPSINKKKESAFEKVDSFRNILKLKIR